MGKSLETKQLRRVSIPVISAILSIIWAGLGQMYNRQWTKGIAFFIIQLSYLVCFYEFLNIGLWGVFTLGTQAGRDHSVMLMAEGIVALIVLLIGLAVYVFNIVNAYRMGEMREKKLAIPTLRESFHSVQDKGFPYLLIGPGLFLIVFVVILPLVYMALLSITNYDLYHSPPAKLVDYVGLENYKNIFTNPAWSKTFLNTFSWTVIWTLLATTLQIGLGLFLAVFVNHPAVRFKRLIRTVLILPWAVPGFVSILVFSGMFNDNFGPINEMIKSIGGSAIPWMTDPFWTRTALIMIQTWLGFPFIFALFTGVLQSIPSDLYEAANMDGASSTKKFIHITLPLLLFATSPLLIMQYAGNFNNFNIIYLFNEGGPPVPGQKAGGTDILISWVFKLTFESFKYNYAAALSFIIGIVIAVFAILQFRKTRSFKDEGMLG